MALPFYTVGHSTRTIAEFADLLRAADVALVVDVRSIPKSRTNPHYNRETLPGHLAPLGIDYDHLAALGGRRRKSGEIPPGVNDFWDNQSFHNYADHALTDPFRAGLDRLIALGRQRPCAVMCSESVWWRCHRRIVADHLLARGEAVFHLMGKDRIEPAKLTPGARVGDGGAVTYPRE